MARTVQEIYDSIIADMANYEALNEMNSVSNTALFKLFAYVFAYAAWTVESLFDLFKADVDEKLLTPAHNARWYQQQALKYQHGDELVWLDSLQAFGYLEVNDDKKIIAHAAAVEQSGRLLVKVVKEVSSDLQPLSNDESAGFLAYINRIKDAGVRISVRSWLPDNLALEYLIKYDPLIMSESGSLLADPAIRPVDEAINSYISNLDFNGRFSIIKLEDAIQAAFGVVDMQRISVKSRQGADDFTDITIDRVAESGYMKLFTSATTISYSAANV
jgi:hypothetical protein